jgi:hypothetical protein
MMKADKIIVLAAVVGMVAMTSCGKKSADGELSDSIVVAETDSMAEVDLSVPVVMDTIALKYSCDDGRFLVDVKVQYPLTGPDVLVDSLRAYIAQELGASPKKVDLRDGDAVVRVYYDSLMTNMKAEYDDVRENMGGEDDGFFSMSNERTIAKSYETEKIITIEDCGSVYAGGAHPLSYAGAVSFDRRTGKRLGTEIFKNLKSKELRNEILRGLREYFEVKSNEELGEMLLGVDYRNIPMPGVAPYFSKNGLEFIYGQYEIAPYACGMPQFTIPYSRVEPLLKEEIVKLIK